MQPALGSAPSSPRPLPGLSHWQDGCCGAQTRTDYSPEGLCQVPVEHHRSANRGHRATWNRGDEKSISCYSWHLCPWQSTSRQCPGEMLAELSERQRRGAQILGVTPCLATVRLFPFMPGAELSRPEKPQCHHSLLLETPLACHPLTHLQAKRDAAAKTTGPGRRIAPATGSSRLVHAEPHRPTWKFSLSTHPVAARRGHTHTHADALLLQGHHCRKESHLLAAAGHLRLMGLCQERVGSAGLASPCEQVRTAIGELSKLDLGPCGLKGNPRHSSPCNTPHLFRLNPNKYKVNDLSETIGEIPA